MKNLFAILIGFFISFASVASPHPLIDQGIEDLYSSHFLTEEQTLTEEQIKITEQIMETLRTEPFQVVFLDQEGKCFTYHSTSDDISPCDTQAENLVNNILVKDVSLNNMSEENGFSHLQSKGVIPIGQVAGLGEWIFGEWVCDSKILMISVGIVIFVVGLGVRLSPVSIGGYLAMAVVAGLFSSYMCPWSFSFFFYK